MIYTLVELLHQIKVYTQACWRSSSVFNPSSPCSTFPCSSLPEIDIPNGRLVEWSTDQEVVMLLSQ